MHTLAKIRCACKDEPYDRRGPNWWQDPPAWDSRGGDVEPPGRGKFLIKVGGRPGIPVQIGLTSIEASLNDTNKKWHTVPKFLLEAAASSLEEGAA